MKNSNKSFLVALFIVLAVVTISGCSGGGPDVDTTDTTDTTDGGSTDGGTDEGATETEITSVDVSISKYTVGDLEGGVRIRAKNLDAETPDFRMDELGGERVVTYDHDEKMGYFYDPDNDQWTQYSGTIAEQIAQAYGNAAKSAHDWAVEYGAGETATISVGDETGEITINEVNPSISDDLLTPPEGANVEEVVMPNV